MTKHLLAVSVTLVFSAVVCGILDAGQEALEWFFYAATFGICTSLLSALFDDYRSRYLDAPAHDPDVEFRTIRAQCTRQAGAELRSAIRPVHACRTDHALTLPRPNRGRVSK